MARSSRRQRSGTPSLLDDDLLSSPELSPLYVPPVQITDLVPELSALDDLRTFNPEDPGRSPSSVYGGPALIGRPAARSTVSTFRMMEAGATPRSLPGYRQPKFAVPRRVQECVRRKTRREVMFSLRRDQRRRGSGSRRRRDEWSNIHC